MSERVQSMVFTVHVNTNKRTIDKTFYNTNDLLWYLRDLDEAEPGFGLFATDEEEDE